jgi:hypothetical protein
MCGLRVANPYSRIVENTHLLDATEIFRKLNVHKKVCLTTICAELLGHGRTD